MKISKKIIRSTAILFTALLLTNLSLDACTGIKLKAKDGSIVHGRTVEFGITIPSSVVFVPRNYKFEGSTPLGKGLTYSSKYAAIGIIAADDLAIMDGLNEAGLSIGVFYFPGYASYTPINSENQSQALSPIEFSNWILTQFATIDEVKAALSNIVIAPTVNETWGSSPPPFHYIVYDKTGNSIVIEPINETLVTYDNPLGVITNSPTFDWHTTNLNNFINLNAKNAEPKKIEGIELAQFGQGSGMVGLPGDFTPPSRFVRAVAFTANAIPSTTANDAILQIFHILNQFDIPLGAVREENNGKTNSDYTLLTIARDPKNGKFYYRTFENQSIRAISLKAFDVNSKTIKKHSTDGKQLIEDVSDKLK